MIKKPLYRYLGKNGLITSLVELLDVKHIAMYRLIAEPGCYLTDGDQKVYQVDIFAEDLLKWQERKNDSDDNN